MKIRLWVGGCEKCWKRRLLAHRDCLTHSETAASPKAWDTNGAINCLNHDWERANFADVTLTHRKPMYPKKRKKVGQAFGRRTTSLRNPVHRVRRKHTVVLIVLAVLGRSPFVVGLSAQDSRPTAQSGDTARAQTGKADSTPNGHIFFRDITPDVGITTMPNSRTDRRYVLETMAGGGIALFDCDNDNKLDMAVVNDSTIEQYRTGGDLMITLYHRDGNSSEIHFTDTTKASGLTTRGWGMAIAVGDYDNDGLADLYVTGYGHNVLYHNLGNCKFEDVYKPEILALAPPGLTMTAMGI